MRVAAVGLEGGKVGDLEVVGTVAATPKGLLGRADRSGGAPLMVGEGPAADAWWPKALVNAGGT